MMLLFQLRQPTHGPWLILSVCLQKRTCWRSCKSLDLVHCAFLHKLSGCVRNITAFGQHLLRLIKLAILADTNISVKPKYLPIYRSNSILHIRIANELQVQTTSLETVCMFNKYKYIQGYTALQKTCCDVFKLHEKLI